MSAYAFIPKQQIKDWFKNHSRAGASKGDGRRQLLDLREHKRKKLPAWQAYSKLYYEKKVKEVVDAQWKVKYVAENPDHDETLSVPPAPLRFRNQIIRQLYEQETDDVKDEVETSREKLGENDLEVDANEDNLGPEE